MRENKFRGIPINKDDEHIDTVLNSIAFYEGDEFYDGTFIYGHLNGEYILGKTIETTDEYYRPSYWIEVDTKTIGQYTGLKDKNGKEIYVGDILVSKAELNQPRGTLYHKIIGKVVNEKGMTYLEGKCIHGIIEEGLEISNYKALLFSPKIYEVIGNIHDNPELLEVKQWT